MNEKYTKIMNMGQSYTPLVVEHEQIEYNTCLNNAREQFIEANPFKYIGLCADLNMNTTNF